MGTGTGPGDGDGPEGPLPPYVSVIELGYEGDRLASRRWTVGDLEAAVHRWEHDAAGRLVRHRVGLDPALHTGAGWPWVEPPAPGSTGEWNVRVWDQIWAAAEPRFERVETRAGERLDDHRETWAWLPDGDGWLLLRGADGFERVSADGVVLAHGRGDVSAPSWVYRREVSDAGRLLSWRYHGEDTIREERETFTYVCE